MNEYTYFGLGIILGLCIATYFFINKEQKIEKRIKLDQKIYSTKKLDNAMEKVVNQIDKKIAQQKRELTEDEKDEIIIKICKEKLY